MTRENNAPRGAGDAGGAGATGQPHFTTSAPPTQTFAIHLSDGAAPGVIFSTRHKSPVFGDGGRYIVPVDWLAVEHSEPGLIQFVVCCAGVVTHRTHSGGFTISTVLVEVGQ